jgi:hypothetical protein
MLSLAALQERIIACRACSRLGEIKETRKVFYGNLACPFFPPLTVHAAIAVNLEETYRRATADAYLA